METALFLNTIAEIDAKAGAGKVRRAVEEDLDWFKALDLNGNGVIDPEEITPNFNKEQE